MADELSEEVRNQESVQGDQVDSRGGNGNPSTSAAIDKITKLADALRASQEKRREEIEARYPRVFGGGTHSPDKSIGTVYWEFGYGWDTLIENLAAAIDREIERDPSLLIEDHENGKFAFKVEQMKEKFGTLRFYYTGGNDRIHGLVDMTENLSASVCEVCGNLGTLCRKNTGSWLKTLCEDCAEKMGYTPVSFDDDGEEAAG
jgi:hypothetical protein